MSAKHLPALRTRFENGCKLALAVGALAWASAVRADNAADHGRAPRLEALAETGALKKLEDGRPRADDERGVLWRVLIAMRQLSYEEQHAWSRGKPPEKLLTDPADYRGEIFTLAGRATQIEQVKLDPDDAQRYQLQTYWRVHLRLDAPADRSVTVDTLDVPQKWKTLDQLDERASTLACFLKNTGAGEHAGSVFVAQRIAWFPANLLGSLGMDVGLLDDVKDRTALSADDRDCFYSLLAAVGRAKPGALLRDAPQNTSVVPLFNDAASMRGKLVSLVGTVVRCTAIRVNEQNDPQFAKAFGLDHYYELELVNLDSQGNPIVFCVRELPPGLAPAEHLATDVRAAGFFMKTWAYRPHARPGAPQEPGAPVAEEPKVRFQLAPLVIGRDVVVLPKEVPQTELVDAVSIGIFGGGLIVVLLGVWWMNREDRWFRRRVKFEPEQGRDRTEPIGPPPNEPSPGGEDAGP